MPLLAVLLFPAAVTLQPRVARLSDLIAEVESQAHLNLTVARELGNELVYVRAAPRPAEEWMRLLAEATAAEWERDDATLRLNRSPGLKRRLEKEETAERAARLRQAVATLVGTPNPVELGEEALKRLLEKSVAANAESRQAPARAFQNQIAIQRDLSPVQRFTRRFLGTGVVDELAKVPVGEVVTWSTRPGRRYRPLRVPAPLLAQYQEDLRKVAGAIAARRGDRSFEEAARDIAYEFAALEKAKPVAAVTLRAERFTLTMMNVAVGFQDADGRQTGDHGISLYLRQTGSKWPDYARVRSVPVPSSPEIADLVAANRGADASPALRTRLSDPVTNEPGDVFLRPLLDLLCDRTHTQAVIGLSDGLIYPATHTLESNPQIGEIAEALEEQTVIETRESLVVGHPRYPIEATAMRADRGLLGRYIRTCDRGRICSLDAAAEYARAQTEGAATSQLEFMVFTALGMNNAFNRVNGMLQMVFSGDRDLLRMVGALTPEMRRTLWAGNPIGVAQMPLPARQALESRMYRRYLFLSGERGRQGFPQWDVAAWLPNGIPGDAYLQGETESTLAAIVAEGPRRGAPIDIQTAAGILFNQSRGEWTTPDLGYPDVRTARLWPTTQRTAKVTVRFAPDVDLNFSLYDYTSPSGEAVPYQQLPNAHRKAMEAALEALRQQEERNRQYQQSQGRGNPPPP
jgi:hypothetical protein